MGRAAAHDAARTWPQPPTPNPTPPPGRAVKPVGLAAPPGGEALAPVGKSALPTGAAVLPEARTAWPAGIWPWPAKKERWSSGRGIGPMLGRGPLAATLRNREAFKTFKAEIGADLSTIDAYAKATRDAGVYERARLAARKKASRQHPVAPYAPRLRFIVSEGALVLTWKGRTRPGTIYHVQRRLTREGVQQPFYHAIAAVAERRYVDTTIPPGTTSVEYIVDATKNGRTAHGFSTGASLHGEKREPQAAPQSRDGRAA